MVTAIAVGAVYFITFATVHFVMKWMKSVKESPTKRVRRPPSLPCLPFIGSLFILPEIKTMHTFFLKKSKELGNIISFNMCDKYVVVLNGRDALQEAFVKQSVTFADRPPFFVNRALSMDHQGLVQHPYNEDFKILHRLSLNILKTYGFGQSIMESRIKEEVDNLLKRFESRNGKAFDPRYEITASVSNVICSIIFGRRWDVDDKHFQEGIELVGNMVKGSEEPSMINFFPFLRFLPRFKRALNNMIKMHIQWQEYVAKTMKVMDKEDIQESFYKNLKSELEKESENGTNPISEKHVETILEMTLRDLFIAGTETTATTLQWFIIIMANRQILQKTIRDEIDRVVGQNNHPSLNHKQHLPLLEATLLEVMRYRTLVPLAAPHSTLKDTYVKELFIPAGTMVFPNLYSAHFDPDSWHEPEKFNIERFLDETKTQVIKKDHVVSFSMGKRSCLGEILARQELFLFASSLVHTFEMYPPDGQKGLNEEENIGVTNCPFAFEMKFVKRRSSDDHV